MARLTGIQGVRDSMADVLVANRYGSSANTKAELLTMIANWRGELQECSPEKEVHDERPR